MRCAWAVSSFSGLLVLSFFFFFFFQRLFSRKRISMYKAKPPLVPTAASRAGRQAAGNHREGVAGLRQRAIALVRHIKGELQQRPGQGPLDGHSQHSHPAVACRLARRLPELRRSCAGFRSRQAAEESNLYDEYALIGFFFFGFP